MINKLWNWIKSFFVEEEFDVEEFSKNADKELEEKLKIIYKTKEYKKAKKEIYEDYEEFKEENKELIGKVFENDEFGFFKIIKVKEPWFLKSPILIDSANFIWKFEGLFDIKRFDGFWVEEISLNELEDFCTECSKEDYKKDVDRNMREFA